MGDDDEEPSSAQDNSLPGHFVQRWNLRILAQEAALGGVANSRRRCLLARNKLFNRADVQGGGDPVLFQKTSDRKEAPRWRGPAKLTAIDNTGLTVKFQSQTFKVAPYCLREKADARELLGGGLEPCFGRMGLIG